MISCNPIRGLDDYRKWPRSNCPFVAPSRQAGGSRSGEHLMTRTNELRTRFENSAPILKVTDMSVSLRYYADVLGFQNADWGTDDFTSVNRDRAAIYLCRNGQGQAGTWVWIGVEDVEALYEEYTATGARIRHPPKNFPWALEMKVDDPDGHVLRFGSERKDNVPFDVWVG
jgi:predicted enzyme related to lactoylglutathione lyase